MGILGIENRTEDWKTASYFLPLGLHGRTSELASKLTGKKSLRASMELFWTGTRDYVWGEVEKNGKNEKETLKQAVVKIYEDQFSTLRHDVEQFGKFNRLNPHNYDVSTEQRQKMLFDNVFNTEVDVVLEDPDYLFIGEAKHEMSFGSRGNLVLVHQLVRQYVMAQILTVLSKRVKKIVPFVVGDDVEKIKNTRQVKFMIDQGWLDAGNVLTWGQISALW